jgi:hypothetical protein
MGKGQQLMKTKILPQIFLSAGLLFASALLLAAGSDRVLNFSNTSLPQPQVGPAPTITTFDVPGAGTDPGQGTFGGGFTPNGTIMGNYIDADNVSHGFLMDRTGIFTTFDAPNAGTGPFQGTFPFGINSNGAITGWYTDEANVNHGFVRDRHGAIVEFDVPGAGTGPGQGPNVYSIAPNGAVTGFFLDPDNVVHGFVREAHGGALGLSKE